MDRKMDAKKIGILVALALLVGLTLGSYYGQRFRQPVYLGASLGIQYPPPAGGGAEIGRIAGEGYMRGERHAEEGGVP